MQEMVARLVGYAEAAGLENCVPYDPTGSRHMFHAEDFGLSITDWTGLGGSGKAVIDVGLAFGLSSSVEPSDIACLRLFSDGAVKAWQIGYDLKGEESPPEICAIAKRFGLTDPTVTVKLISEQALEAGFAMIDLIIRTKIRSDSPLSIVPAPRFLVSSSFGND